jgi:hypothetical protein
MSKRKCIFTGQPANFKATVSHEDQHNWAKSVPCTKQYWNAYLKHRPFNELEIRLVELFFQQEIAQLKMNTLESRMEKLREQLADGMNSFNTVDKLKFYKPDIKFGEEMEQDIKEKVKEIQYSKVLPEELIGLPDEDVNIQTIDEPKDLKKEDVEKILEKKLKIPQKSEVILLTTSKNDDKIEKKVVKKKPKTNLWD